MEYQEFIGKLQKRGSKPHKISHCLGARDAFEWVRSHHWITTNGQKVDKLLYSQIISEVNKILAEKLLEGHEVEFPYQMGSLVLSRTPAKVRYKDGELLTNYRTDWKKTLEYRFSESPDTPKRIKRVQPFIYSIQYYKKGARYHNRAFYIFRINRSLVKALGAAIERGKINAETVKGYRHKDMYMTKIEKS